MCCVVRINGPAIESVQFVIPAQVGTTSQGTKFNLLIAGSMKEKAACAASMHMCLWC
jgi:hypothetical protein